MTLNIHFTEPPQAPAVAKELAYELVRAYAAIDALLQRQYEEYGDSPPREVADDLILTIAARFVEMVHVFGAEDFSAVAFHLAEAVDNLGNGVTLEPDAAPAFAGPRG